MKSRDICFEKPCVSSVAEFLAEANSPSVDIPTHKFLPEDSVVGEGV